MIKLPSNQQNHVFIAVGPPEKVVIDENESWLNVIPKEGVLDLVARKVFSGDNGHKLN